MANVITRPLYEAIAATLNAYYNCIVSGNKEWRDKHKSHLHSLEAFLPSGSGIDNRTTIILEVTPPTGPSKKFQLRTAFHHMDEHGGYDGWSHHIVTVSPDWKGIDMKISGPSRNGIKDYLYQVFDTELNVEVWYDRDDKNYKAVPVKGDDPNIKRVPLITCLECGSNFTGASPHTCTGGDTRT